MRPSQAKRGGGGWLNGVTALFTGYQFELTADQKIKKGKKSHIVTVWPTVAEKMIMRYTITPGQNVACYIQEEPLEVFFTYHRCLTTSIPVIEVTSSKLIELKAAITKRHPTIIWANMTDYSDEPITLTQSKLV